VAFQVRRDTVERFRPTMIDLHTHILPAVDDGVGTEDEAVAFARMAHADGVRTIVATPHCKDGFFVNERADVLARVAALDRRLRQEGVAVELLPGAEVHLCPDLVERVRDGRAPTLADNGKTLLLELSLTHYPIDLENLVFQLKLAGIEPLFAHPERIRYFQEDVRRYEVLVEMGATGQITSGSILGSFGTTAREFSEELLHKGLVHVLASDGHNVGNRRPLISEAREAMVAVVGERRAAAMVDEIPRALLAGRQPDVPPVERARGHRTSIISRLFRRG
jgi:protein-tyrosine phosphatase